MAPALSPSLEVTGDDLEREGASLAQLPGAWDVFIAHLGGQTVEEVIQDCLRVRQLGHQPVPHLPARRYRNPEQLAEAIRLLHHEAAVREALVLAGDAEPAGSLKDSLDVLDSGVLEPGMLERVWFSGYPEGHPQIDEECLEKAWERKRNWSRSCRIPIGVVTQLARNPSVSAEWCRRRRLGKDGIAVRISRFLFARPEILEDLARLAGMPALLQRARESGGAPYVCGPAAEHEEESVLRACAPHYLALGALRRTAEELSELWGDRNRSLS